MDNTIKNVVLSIFCKDIKYLFVFIKSIGLGKVKIQYIIINITDIKLKVLI